MLLLLARPALFFLLPAAKRRPIKAVYLIAPPINEREENTTEQ